MTLYLVQRGGSFVKRNGQWTQKREEAAFFDRILTARKFCSEQRIMGAELVMVVAAGEEVWIPVMGLDAKPAVRATGTPHRTHNRPLSVSSIS